MPNLALHSAARSYTEQAQKLVDFEQAVEELAQKVHLSRKDFRNDDFVTSIKQAVFSVTNTEVEKMQALLVEVVRAAEAVTKAKKDS
ncbi:MAG: hypothetical protein IMZ61_16000 [Planctomycetes bacterium]|nr:hypothetical protein [Planctomycetota bacterium]